MKLIFPVPVAAAAIVAPLVISASAVAYVPKQDIKVERTGLTTFKLTGKNTRGDLSVEIKDQNLFQGFKGEGTNGTAKVEFEIRSDGLGKGWKIEGKNGDTRFELRVKKKNILDKEWEVTGKVGDKEVSGTVMDDVKIDPAVQATLLAFDV
jgi:DnaJ-class molecular chaperone